MKRIELNVSKSWQEKRKAEIRDKEFRMQTRNETTAIETTASRAAQDSLLVSPAWLGLLVRETRRRNKSASL